MNSEMVFKVHDCGDCGLDEAFLEGKDCLRPTSLAYIEGCGVPGTVPGTGDTHPISSSLLKCVLAGRAVNREVILLST